MTLCCTTALTVHPSGLLLLLCYYLLIFALVSLLYTLVGYLLRFTRLYPIIKLILSPPPLFSFFFFLLGYIIC